MGIPIPYGTDYKVEVSGSMLKTCRCEACEADFLYLVERTAEGSGTSLLWLDNQGAKGRAAEAARKGLDKALEKAIDAVPCPACGWLQSDMVRMLKRRRLWWSVGIGIIVSAALLLWGLFVADESDPFFTAATIAFLLAWPMGLGLSRHHEPNHGHEEEGIDRASRSAGIPREKYDAEQAAEYQAFLQLFHETLQQVMAAMIGVEGRIDRAEVETVLRIYEQVTGLQLAISDIQSAAESLLGNSELAVKKVEVLAPSLNDEARAIFVRACIVVAGADRNVDDKEWQFVVSVAAAAGMGSAQFDAVVEQLTNPVDEKA